MEAFEFSNGNRNERKEITEILYRRRQWTFSFRKCMFYIDSWVFPSGSLNNSAKESIKRSINKKRLIRIRQWPYRRSVNCQMTKSKPKKTNIILERGSQRVQTNPMSVWSVLSGASLHSV